MNWRKRHAAITHQLDDLLAAGRLTAWSKETAPNGTWWSITIPPHSAMSFTTYRAEQVIAELTPTRDAKQLELAYAPFGHIR